MITINHKKYTPYKNKRDQLEELAIQKGVTYSTMRNLFLVYVAHYILYRIRKAVKEQKIGGRSMKSAYKPLNPKYRKSKPYGTKGKFWIKDDVLIRKLGVYIDVEKKEVHIGFRGDPTHIKSKEKVRFIKTFRALEYGSKKKNIPARPLVRPMLKSTRKNITWLFDRFTKTIEVPTSFKK